MIFEMIVNTILVFLLVIMKMIKLKTLVKLPVMMRAVIVVIQMIYYIDDDIDSDGNDDDSIAKFKKGHLFQ